MRLAAPAARRGPVSFLALVTITGGVFALPADGATANVKLTAVNRAGEKVQLSGSAINVATGKVTAVNAGSPASVPAGTYVVGAYINDYPALTVAARTVRIGGSTTVQFDSRKGRKVTFSVGDPSVAPVDLAVAPMAVIKGKPRAFVPPATKWPATNTYVLPDGAATGVRLGVHGVLAASGASSPVRYDLAYSLAGMPSAVSFSTTKAKLARVDLTVATLDSDQSSRLALTAKLKNLAPVTGVPVGLDVLGKQVNYRTPGLQWGTDVAMNSLGSSAFLGEDRKAKKLIYAAGKTYREEWGVGVWAPSPARPAIYAQNGKLAIAGGPPICAFSGAGVTLTSCQVQPQTFSYTLGPGRSSSYGSGPAVSATIDASAPKWYTATMSGSRQGTGELATSVSAKWYFQAGGRYRRETATAIYTGENPVLPGYIRITAKGADARNRVAGGAKTPLTLSVLQFGKVAGVTLQYSGDGGRTWKAAKATRKGASWVASVPAPKSGAVSLKVRAKSATGATVEQTVVNAYGVR